MTTSGRAKVIGLIAAGMTAWTLSTGFDLGPPLIEARVWPLFGHAFGSDFDFAQFKAVVFLYALFGIPLALAFVLLAGYPAWTFWDSRGLTRRRDAIRLGAWVGLFLSLAMAAVTLVGGWRTMTDPSSSYDSWSGGQQVIADGMPTLLGWFFQLIDLALTVVTGAATGLTAWTVAVAMDRRWRTT